MNHIGLLYVYAYTYISFTLVVSNVMNIYLNIFISIIALLIAPARRMIIVHNLHSNRTYVQ